MEGLTDKVTFEESLEGSEEAMLGQTLHTTTPSRKELPVWGQGVTTGQTEDLHPVWEGLRRKPRGLQERPRTHQGSLRGGVGGWWLPGRGDARESLHPITISGVRVRQDKGGVRSRGGRGELEGHPDRRHSTGGGPRQAAAGSVRKV